MLEVSFPFIYDSDLLLLLLLFELVCNAVYYKEAFDSRALAYQR